MRTTIRLDDDLLAEIKKLAVSSNRTMTAIIEDALRQMLAQHREIETRRQPVRLITVDGNGPLPGVDLDDSTALLELMERGR